MQSRINFPRARQLLPAITLGAVLCTLAACSSSGAGEGSSPPGFAFAADTATTRMLAENTPAAANIGAPFSVIQAASPAADITYTLDTEDGANFAIVGAQLKTKSGARYDYEDPNLQSHSYSVTITATDGRAPGAARAEIVLSLTLSDVDEPPAAPEAVRIQDTLGTQIALRWTAAAEDAARPPVSGYLVQRCTGERTACAAGGSGSWEDGATASGRSTTEATLTELNYGSQYHVRVRATNAEGHSPWSAPLVESTTRATWMLTLGNASSTNTLALELDADTAAYIADVFLDSSEAEFNTPRLTIFGGQSVVLTPPCTRDIVLSGGAAGAPRRFEGAASCDSATGADTATLHPGQIQMSIASLAAAGDAGGGDTTSTAYTAPASGQLFVYTRGATENATLRVVRDSDGTVVASDAAALAAGEASSAARRGEGSNPALAFAAAAAEDYTITLSNAHNAAQTELTLHIRYATAVATGVEGVAAGGRHTCFVLGGAVSCAGNNRYGRLGAGLSATSDVQTSDAVALLRPLGGLASGVVALAVALRHGCAATGTGLYCWGYNFSGQLGDGSTSTRNTPVQVMWDHDAMGATPPLALDQATAVSAGTTVTCAIRAAAVLCWGTPLVGSLGDAAMTLSSALPVSVAAPLNAGVSAISLGSNHFCALAGAKAYCWGSAVDGRLGTGSNSHQPLPAEVAFSDNSGITALSAGNWHTCAIKGGAAFCWGAGADGRLGDGQDNADQRVPVEVVGLASGVSAITAGVQNSCAIHDADGAGGNPPVVKCWGAGSAGRLGRSLDTDSATAVEVLPPGFTPTALSTGYSAIQTCAWSSTSLACWGFGEDGQLGSGQVENQSAPVPVYDSRSF